MADIVDTLLDLANEIEGGDGEYIRIADAVKAMRDGAEEIETLRRDLTFALQEITQAIELLERAKKGAA
jgi:hypothetical protein